MATPYKLAQILFWQWARGLQKKFLNQFQSAKGQKKEAKQCGSF
jgi:hypothetical protein